MSPSFTVSFSQVLLSNMAYADDDEALVDAEVVLIAFLSSLS